MSLRRTHRGYGLGIAAAVFLIDQLTKWIVTYPLDLAQRGMIEIVPFFDLKWVENRGVSMGFLHADTTTARWLLVAMTSAIAIAVTVWLWREKGRGDVAALGMVLDRKSVV